MIDNLDRTNRSNRIFSVIRQFEVLFPEEFGKCDIKKCGHCDGTGISNKSSLSQCTYCGGMGYRGFEKIQGDFVCRTCNGYGCKICDHNGIVDWITHARSNDMTKGKYIR